MIRTRIAPLSVQEIRLLSELVKANDCKPPLELALDASVPRNSVYVLLHRLAKQHYVIVKRKPTQAQPGAVVYCITAAGRHVREEYARMVGLKP